MSSDFRSVMELLAKPPEGRPSWEEYFMAVALLIATRSPCERIHVGCVLVTMGNSDNHIVASGYNGFLAGLPHESCIREGHELATVHAEQNAIADAAKRGVAVAGAHAYVTHHPCVHCAKILLAAGISRICYREDYANDSLVERLCALASVPIVHLR